MSSCENSKYYIITMCAHGTDAQITGRGARICAFHAYIILAQSSELSVINPYVCTPVSVLRPINRESPDDTCGKLFIARRATLAFFIYNRCVTYRAASFPALNFIALAYPLICQIISFALLQLYPPAVISVELHLRARWHRDTRGEHDTPCVYTQSRYTRPRLLSGIIGINGCAPRA